MVIRQAQLEDRDRLLDLYVSAFSDAERDAVAGLAVNLLAEETTPETFALVAEVDDRLVGHVGFSPVAHTNTDTFVGYILAPLAVHPEHQKRGIGTELIASGFERLSFLSAAIVFVYGDPQFYGRFGFDARIAAQYTPPYELEYDFGWQAKRLTEVNTLPASGELTCVFSLMVPHLW
jgi:putative acetyltransferase